MIRGELMINADLLSAVRLPNNLFTDNANTEVGSDLIVLQKHDGKTDGTTDEALFIAGLSDGKDGLATNNYYKEHPDRIIHTDAKRDTDPYGKPAMVYTHSGGVEGIATDLYQMLSADLSARLDLERYNGIKGERQETRQTVVVQPIQMEAKRENDIKAVAGQQPEVKREENPVQSVAQEVETKRSEAPVMDLYDLFGYTQEERRLAERGLKPGRQKGKSKRRKQTEQSLFSPSELKQMEVKPEKKEKPKPELPAGKPGIDDDPEDAVYRSLDWETNPPINGFYETMMSLTPEQRAELRRMGKEKMDANAAKQAEKVRPVYPIENAYEVQAKKQIERVEREMRDEEAALTPEERQRRKEKAMMPRPFKGIMEPHLKDGSLVCEHTGGVRFQIGVLKDVTRYGATFQPLDMEGMQAQKAQLYIDLRNTYERLYAHEAENHEENALLRRNLNTYYDEFVMRYGNLNAKHNANLILMDASGRNMLSLERGEDGKFVKADVFDHPVSFSQETLVEVESPEEALSASLNLYGGVNLP